MKKAQDPVIAELLRIPIEPAPVRDRQPARRKAKSSAGRPTKKAIEVRAKRVMDIATALFIEKGYAETTLDEIAQRSGVAKRTLYNEYKDKANLFAMVVRQRISLAVTPTFEGAGHDVSVPAALLHLARQVLTICTAPDTVQLQRLMIGEAQRFPEFIHQTMRLGLNALYTNTADFLGELCAAKDLRPVDDMMLTARRFCDIVVGMASLHATFGAKLVMMPSDAELLYRVRMFAFVSLTYDGSAEDGAALS